MSSDVPKVSPTFATSFRGVRGLAPTRPVLVVDAAGRCRWTHPVLARDPGFGMTIVEPQPDPAEHGWAPQ